VALGFVALALLLRAPALLYSVINFDESLYLLIGDELRRGILPFTQLCDRKPFGLFALFALFASAPVDAIVASRLGASLVVGLTGYLLRRVAGLLFDDRPRLIGSAAGLAYVVFCLADGGLASNAELFLNLLATLILLFVLKAIRSFERPRFGLMLAAGLVLGLGLQIKQTILFDMLALLAGFYLLTTSRLSQLGRHIRATVPSLAALSLASTLPTLAVILLYVVTGHWHDWAWANVEAQRGFIDDPAQPLAWHPAFWAMVEQAPLWFGLLLAAAISRWLVRDGMEARAVAFLLAWVAAVALAQLFLRIAADHYFLQFLPALCLLNGLVLGRGLLAHVTGALARVGVLAALVGLTIFAVAKNPIVNALYVAHDRYLQGESWAGDVPRQAAADLKPLLQPGDALYAVGFLPVIYHLTGAEIPTRFAFTGLPHRSYAGRDGCPWVTQEAELQRILDTRPRFIFVEQGVFYAQLTAPVRALLDDHLARAYRLLKSYPGHGIHGLYPFERFVMNGAASAKLYELSAPALQ
jgi:hypothetical protein